MQFSLAPNGRALMVASILLAIHSNLALAQDPPGVDLESGHRIKVVLLNGKVAGSARLFSARDSIQLWVRARPTGAELSVPIIQIRQLLVQFGDRPATGKGAGVGFTVGVLGGAFAGLTYAFVNEPPCCDQGHPSAKYGFRGAILGAAAGLVVGAVVGRGLREPSWLQIEPLTIPASTGRRASFGLTLRF